MELTIRMLAPLLLVVASNVTYQLLCKSTPASLNPFTGLFASYGVSCLLCFVLMLATKQEGIGEELRQIRPLNLILGMVIIGVEGGYLLMYRNGWQVSKGPLAAYICAAVVLLVIGAVFYREGLSPQKLAGMGLCLAGIFLINLK